VGRDTDVGNHAKRDGGGQSIAGETTDHEWDNRQESPGVTSHGSLAWARLHSAVDDGFARRSAQCQRQLGLSCAGGPTERNRGEIRDESGESSLSERRTRRETGVLRTGSARIILRFLIRLAIGWVLLASGKNAWG
jgi:hypothetical protein